MLYRTYHIAENFGKEQAKFSLVKNTLGSAFSLFQQLADKTLENSY